MEPRLLLVGLLVLAFGTFGPAQQTGNSNRNYIINSVGSGGTSPVLSNALVGSQVNNRYTTMDSNQPVIWAASTDSVIGWHVTATNSVDIGPTNLIFLGNGTSPFDPFAPLFRTNGAGVLDFNVPAPAFLGGQSYYFAMAHAAPTSPDGFYVSQTHRVTFVTDPSLSPSNPVPTPGGNPLVLGDDANVSVNLGFSFSYYGTSYQTAYVGSNGYVTFQSGDTSYTPSTSAFLAGPPRIAVWWTDLNPSTNGTVASFTSAAGVAEFSWSNVPQYPSTGSNTMKVTIYPGAAIVLDYGAMTAQSGLVGLTGASKPLLALNLSAAPNTITGQRSPYQLFDAANPNDLAGLQVNFVIDANGYPTLQF